MVLGLKFVEKTESLVVVEPFLETVMEEKWVILIWLEICDALAKCL